MLKPSTPINRFFSAITLPVIGLCLVALIDSRIHQGDLQLPNLNKAVSVAYILLVIGLIYRFVCSVALDVLLAKATGRQVPRILKHLIGIAAALIAILLSINVLYSGAFTGFIAFSSVIAVVIGFALRPIILDIFSGLSANLDSAFHIGDWIEIGGRNGGASYTGWVEEINWRTTHIKTRTGNLVICPNSAMSVAIITNYSRPSRLSRYDLEVELPPEVDPERARSILSAAVQATLGVQHGPSSERAPDVIIAELEASGVDYQIRFWLDPALNSIDTAKDLVSRSVLRHLKMAGIPLAENVTLYRKHRDILDVTDSVSRAAVLGRAALFHGVQSPTLVRLAEHTLLHSFVEGDIIIREGGEDNDMYLLAEGVVDVLVTVEEKEVSVSRMQPGDYFGEMSLLTGEPRTATIRALTAGLAYRIGRSSIAPVLESDPKMMNLLSLNLAERNLKRQAKASAQHDDTPERKQESLAAIFLGKMKGIFRSGG